jgi:catechol 2,3-dioxygenase-like lactoylglutathione lyase family enzyme
MAAAPLRIDHLAYPTFDVPATVRFYTEVMRCPLVDAMAGASGWGGKPFLHLCFGIGSGQMITFFAVDGLKRPRGDGLPKDIRHVALAVRSRAAIAAWKRRLTAAKIDFWEEDHGGFPSLYFSDPNNVMIEVTYHPPSTPSRGTSRPALAVVREWAAGRRPRR